MKGILFRFVVNVFVLSFFFELCDLRGSKSALRIKHQPFIDAERKRMLGTRLP